MFGSGKHFRCSRCRKVCSVLSRNGSICSSCSRCCNLIPGSKIHGDLGSLVETPKDECGSLCVSVAESVDNGDAAASKQDWSSLDSEGESVSIVEHNSDVSEDCSVGLFEDVGGTCCINCRREELPPEYVEDESECCTLVLSVVTEKEINWKRRKWRCFDKASFRDSTKALCQECFSLLRVGDCNDCGSNNWPVVVWRFLSCGKLRELYGRGHVVAIPYQWLKYWVSALVLKEGWEPGLLLLVSVSTRILYLKRWGVDVTAERVKNLYNLDTEFIPICKDVTKNQRRMKGILDRLRLGEMKKTLDDLLVPCVLCPWGCTEYMHKTGELSLQAVLSRYFPESGNKVCCDGYRNVNRVMSARGDYFSKNIGMHLCNPEWSVHPCVVFVEGRGPVVQTCREHDGGCTEMYFHLPRTVSLLPALQPDSLSHAVVRSRLLKASKAHQYSNSFQLTKCSANYCGIDTCYVGDSRNFGFQSHLSDLNEAVSYAGREDIRGLVGRLVVEKKMPEELGSDIATRSRELFGGSTMLDEFAEGATMMVLLDCMRLQHMLYEPQIVSVLTGDESKKVSVRKTWNSALIYVHSMDCFGAMIPHCAAMRSTRKTKEIIDLRHVWVTLNLLLSLPRLWEIVGCAVANDKQWFGHALTFLSWKVLHQSHKGQHKHPFLNYFLTPFGLSNLMVKNDARLEAAPQSYVAQHTIFLFDEIIREGSVQSFAWRNATSFMGMEASLCTFLEEKECGCDVLLVYGDYDHRSAFHDSGEERVIPEVLVVGSERFELRFLCITTRKCESAEKKRKSSDIAVALDAWNGVVVARHGGSIFTGWWMSQRSAIECPATKVKDLRSIWREREDVTFDIAAYVKCKSVDLQQYRRDYLKYIGGQDRILCGVHDVPLITSPPKSICSRRCTVNSSCVNYSRFCCPFEGCCTSICIKCYKVLPDDKMTSIVPGETVGLFCHKESTKKGQECNLRDNGDPQDTSDLEINEVYGMELDESATDLHMGDYGLIEDVENAPVDDACDHIHDFNLPTTNAYSEGQEATGTFGVMGCSVLLNKCGTMLVRRQTQLQAARRERNILERVVSAKDIGTVPLIYLEGILFPSIFWRLPHSSHGGVLGSIPTALFCQHNTRKKLNVASIADHAKVRLKSTSSTAASDPRYLSFVFDSLANGAIEGHDTRVVLSRGFEASMGSAGLRMRNGDDDFFTDTIDNRQNVHNLCASEREEPSTLFLTMTCNQKQHFGVRMVKNYLDSDRPLVNYLRMFGKQFPNERKLTARAKQEVKRAFEEAARNLIVRNWMELRVLLIKYLSESPEKAAGNVLKIFVRDEYQADVGNLSHLHMLITLSEKYESAEGRKWLESIIRSTIDDIVGYEEVEQYIEEGLLDSWEDYREMKNEAGKFLKHTCSSRCMRRTGAGKGDLVCRVPDPRQMSKDTHRFYEYSFDVVHSEEALNILERLGFCMPRSETGGTFVPLHDFLKPKRILPPVRPGEGNISPVIGRLFAATRSQMNVQICTSFGTSRYIVKYLIKIDEGHYIVFGCDLKSEGKMRAEHVFLHNTKISSSAANEKAKLSKSRDKQKNKGRQIAATEKMQLIWGFPQVTTNIKFVPVSTLPFGERSGVERVPPSSAPSMQNEENLDSFDLIVPVVAERKRLFSRRMQFRCHTISQEALLRDQMESAVSLDKVFIFGVRPPELLLVDKLEWYYRFFVRSDRPVLSKKSKLSDFVKRDLLQSSWIDGLGYMVLLRPTGLKDFARIVCTDSFVSESKKKGLLPMQKLLHQICSFYVEAGLATANERRSLTFSRSRQWEHLQRLFVAQALRDTRLPIPVFSNVVPKNALRFITHIVLSMGHFETENDVWTCASMCQVFRTTRLIGDGTGAATAEEVDSLLKRWINEQLRFYPIGSKRMDEYMVSACEILRSVLIQDQFPMNEIPPYMYTSLVRNTEDSIELFLKNCKETLVNAVVSTVASVYEGRLDVIPNALQLNSATKTNIVNWNSVFPRTERQSIQSYEEQASVQYLGMKAIDDYISCGSSMTKNVAIAGPPGAGKTHCMMHTVTYALAKGLFVMTTAILADRAFVLGGRHIHSLFKLVVRNSGSPYRIAELAVINLQKYPASLELLRRLDVLCVDELSQLSAQQLSTLDIIMRRIRDSSLFMGGVLVVGSIDQVQLRPIKGLPFLLSPFIIATFSMAILREYVRCSKCLALQEMNAIARFFTSDKNLWLQELRRFEAIVRQACTFVSGWNSPELTKDVVTIFPRKHQTIAATDRFIKKKQQELLMSGGSLLVAHAEDQMLSVESHGEWKVASTEVAKFLDAKCKEPAELHLFAGCYYTFTFNSPGNFNQTQIGLLLEMPDQETVRRFAPIKIWVAPAGTHVGLLGDLSKQLLLESGWKEVSVGVSPVFQHTMWEVRVKARRRQYGIKIRISSTIHAAIGHSLGRIATQLSLESNLWERAMVVVLISRVSRASDLIFVGDKESNIKALLHGLCNKDQYDEYMNHVVDVIVNNTSARLPRAIQQNLHPFRPKDIPLPAGNTYVVYLLISARDMRSTYVGVSQNLSLRMRQHNSGIGSKTSADPTKRPWALYAYVAGFMNDKKAAFNFEKSWQRSIQYVRPRRVLDAAALASPLIAQDYLFDNLTLVLCSEK